MQNYGITSLIGGITPGTHFTDVYYMNHDGEFPMSLDRIHVPPAHIWVLTYRKVRAQ